MDMRRGLFATLCAAVAIGSCTAPGRAQTGYTVVDLGTLGGAWSEATAINKKGQVVGTSATAGGSQHGFIWSVTSGMEDLMATLGLDFSACNAINNSEQVVGTSTGTFLQSRTDPMGGTVTLPVTGAGAFLWSREPNGPLMTYLGYLGDNPFNWYRALNSYAMGINDAGEVAVRSDVAITNEYGLAVGFGAFVYDNGSQRSIGFPAGGTQCAAAALSINNRGWLALDYSGVDPTTLIPYQTGYVLRAQNTTGNAKWFRDDNADGVNDLLVKLPTSGGPSTFPYGINDKGQVVGETQTWTGSSVAFLWTDINDDGQTSAMDMTIFALPDDIGSWAQAVNNAGVVVGGSYDAVRTRYFVYDATHGIRNLGAMLPTGWQIDRIVSINDNGEILGAATYGGASHAVVMKPISTTLPAASPAAPLSDVTVTPDSTTSVHFEKLLSGGTVEVVPLSVAPPLPEGFDSNGVYVDIKLSAGVAFQGEADVVVSYDPSKFPYTNGAWTKGAPKLFHYSSTLDRWQDITTFVNIENHLVCGRTASFSPFAIVQEVPVSYTIAPLYDQDKVKKLGSTVPITLQLRDAAGNNVSSADRVVTARGWVYVNGNASGLPEDPGNANPDYNFRYDADLQGYVYNFQTKGLPSAGTYRLTFQAGLDPSLKSVQLKVK
jgi:probable HAF family extracellular repeat protein